MEMCLFSFHQSCQTRCAVEASVSESQLLLSLYHESCKVDFDCQFLISILCSYTVRMAQKKGAWNMTCHHRKKSLSLGSPRPPLPCPASAFLFSGTSSSVVVSCFLVTHGIAPYYTIRKWWFLMNSMKESIMRCKRLLQLVVVLQIQISKEVLL